MAKRTPLYDQHVAMGAKMVDFDGWDMPLHYGSQIEEHHRVRNDAGMFDVSHMVVIEVRGEGSRDYLSMLLANDIHKLKTRGKALYSCMLNSEGGVIDDLIVYYLGDDWFRIVSNAGTRKKDLQWIRAAANEFDDIEISERDDLAIIAIQGPNARDKTYAALGENLRQSCDKLKPFHAITIGDLFIATTGYTGEAGFEIILPSKPAGFTWQMLHEAGVAPIGLGARDTLRLEAGMNLYGQDMDETTTPWESGLSWTVAMKDEDRNFIGRAALLKQKASGIEHHLVGLVLQGRGVLRPHQKVQMDSKDIGEITSGSFSPTLNKSIALARISISANIGQSCQVVIRGRAVNARIVKYPFVRNGKSCLEPEAA
jgi:glycine cleavage system T protein (aminomethyltransferase)